LKREPKQERSRRIVDAVLDGATRILESAPLAKTTTNRIAEIAGVGIGSLYDYFPNKESIVISLMDRHVHTMMRDFVDLLDADPGLPLEEKFAKVAAFLENRTLQHRDFLREIFNLAPMTGRIDVLLSARAEAVTKVAAFVQRERPQISAEQSRRKAFLLVHGVIGLVESYIMVVPPEFTPGEFAEEIRKLMPFLLNS
jgi:AcrR family transcriptional regulator